MFILRLKHGDQTVREKICRDFPVKIGRGSTCDFVLPDKTVSIEHAVIEQTEEGVLTIKDLGSQNGIFVRRRKVESVTIEEPTHVIIGLSEIEIEPISEEPPRKFGRREWKQINRRRGFMHHIFYTIIGGLFLAAASVMNPEFWSPTTSNQSSAMIWAVARSILLIFFSGFVLLAIHRSLSRKLRLADTLAALTRIAFIYLIAKIVSVFAYYIVFADLRQTAVFLILGTMTVWITIYLAALRRPKISRKFVLSWGIGTALFLILFEALSIMDLEEVGYPNTDYFVLPPVAGYVGPSIDMKTFHKEISRITSESAREATLLREQRKTD
jgi:hypothetical protein